MVPCNEHRPDYLTHRHHYYIKFSPLNTSQLSPLKQTPFILLSTFRVGITMNYQMVTVAVGWQMYQLTHNVLSLGLIGLAEVVPYFLTALIGGYLVDHYPRKRLAVMAATVHVLLAILVTLTANIQAPWMEYYLYGVIGLAGMARAFIRPVFQALFSTLLPREAYERGSALNSSLFQACLMLGPALCGFLIAQAGLANAYMVACVFAVIATIAISSIGQVPYIKPSQSQPIFTSIGEGLRFVFGHPMILGALSLDMFAVLFGGAVSILPAFIDQVLQGDPTVLGLLRAAPFLGSTLIGLVMVRFTLSNYAGPILLGCVAGFGLSMIGFGLSTTVPMAFIWLLMSGVFDGVSVVLRTTMLQLCTPDDMRGRVSSINGIFIGSSNELGAFESGLAASAMGLVPSIIFGGCMTIIVVIATLRWSPTLRGLKMSDIR